MSKLLLITTIAVILCNNLFASADLTLSKDSIIAFDGKLWDGRFDDSIEIRNVSSKKAVIDSIKIILSENEYPEFQIGWFIKSVSQPIQIFNSANRSYEENCGERGITLTEYNNLSDGNKLSIPPNGKIVIQSPYVSNTCSLVGVILEIVGPLPEIEIINRSSTGKISFFSNNIEYSMYLNVTLYKWPTSAISHNKKVMKQAILKTPQKTITLLGRAYNPGGKLQMYRPLVSKKQDNTVYIVK
jgi:hypothetical protein